MNTAVQMTKLRGSLPLTAGAEATASKHQALGQQVLQGAVCRTCDRVASTHGLDHCSPDQQSMRGEPCGCSHQPLVTGAELTSHISNCKGLVALIALCSAKRCLLNPIHISAALSVCARQSHWSKKPFQQRQQQHQLQHQQPLQLQCFVADMLQLLSGQLHLSAGRELSTVMWCMVKLQHPVGASTLQPLLARYADVAHSSSYHSTAIVLYVLAKLRFQPDPAVVDSLMQSMIKSCRSGSVWRGRHSSVSHCAAAVRQHQGGWGQPRQPQQLIRRDGAGSDPAWMRALGQAVWALARMEQQALTRKWLLPLLHLFHEFGTSAQSSSTQAQAMPTSMALPSARTSGASCQACAMLLWACATVLCDQSSLHSPQQLSTACPGQQRGSQPPPPPPQQQQQQHTQRFSAAVVQQATLLLHGLGPELHGLQPQSACMMLWSVNRLLITPDPTWCQQFYAATLSISHLLSPSQCGALLCGVVQLPVRPPAALCACCLAGLGGHLHQLPATQLSHVLRACARLRVRPPAGWLGSLLDAFLARHQQHTPAAVSTLLHAASRVGFRPATARAKSLLRVVEQTLPTYSPHDLAKVLSGCATLRLELPDQLQQALLQAFMQQLQAATPSDVTLVLRALATWSMQQQRLLPQQHTMSQAAAYAAVVAKPAEWACGCKQGLANGQVGTCNTMWTQRLEPYGLRAVPSMALTYCSTLPLAGQQQGCSCCVPFSSCTNFGPCIMPCSCFCVASAAADTLLAAVYPALHCMRAVEVCQCVWAAACLLNPSGFDWGRAINSIQPSHLHDLSLGDICLLFWSLSRLQQGQFVNPSLLQRLLLRSQQLMLAGACTPQDLSSFIWGYWQACGSLGRQLPVTWLHTFRVVVARQLHLFSMRQLGVMLRACVLLQVPLGCELLQAVILLLEVRSAQLSMAELRGITQSTAALQRLQQQVGAVGSLHRTQPHQGVSMPLLFMDSAAAVASECAQDCSSASGVLHLCTCGGRVPADNTLV